MGKNWRAGSLCVTCGSKIPAGHDGFNLCVPCQQAKACRTRPPKLAPLTATAIIDVWSRA